MARRKKKKMRIFPIFAFIILLLIAGLGGYYLMSSDTDISKEPEIKKEDKIEKKDVEKDDKASKQVVDFTDESIVLQKKVESVTSSFLKTKIKEVKSEEKTINRTNNKGKLKWQEKTYTISVDNKISVNDLVKKLNTELSSKKGKVYRQEKEKYNGKNAERIDISYSDTLGGEALTLIVAKIYVLLPDKPQEVKKLGHGKLAIIVDDCGYDIDTVSKMTSLKQKITYAIIPSRKYSKDALSIIRRNGKQAMLHLPMEPLDAKQQSEKQTVTVNMTDEEIKQLTLKYINELPGVKGVNNHQGSRATADERVMKAVLSVVKSKKLFFIDSNTQPKTVAHKVANKMGVKTNLNRAFLDGKADVEYIKGRMRQAGKSAIQNGSYIAICHARPKTVIALTEMVSELEAMGVEFVFVSSLLY